MHFKTMNEFELWIENNSNFIIGSGSQGQCYKIGNQVFKIFLQYIDKYFYEDITYDIEEILRFSSIKNNTYVWPKDIITVGDTVVGYVMDYVDAKSLHKINPLKVSLDKIERCIENAKKDIKIISDNGVLSFDVMSNILYGKCGFKVIDTMEYSMSNMDSGKLYNVNLKRFTSEIRLFLIDDYFDYFIDNNKELHTMFDDQDVDFVLFLKEFRKKLSENEGYEISKLADAKKSVTRIRSIDPLYKRNI